MWTGYSTVLRRAMVFLKLSWVLLPSLILAVGAPSLVHAASGAVDGMIPASSFAQAASNAEANLPFLFAVYLLTWAGFFAYAFYMSRRQREMRRDIKALKQALSEYEEANSRD